MILFAFPPVALPTSGLRVEHSLPSQPSGTPSELYEIISQENILQSSKKN